MAYKKQTVPSDTISRFQKNYGPWAIITGASAGIGVEFARQIAASGVNVVLTARRTRKLDALAVELRSNYGVEVRVVPVDLTRRGFIDTIKEATAGLEIGLLVNNAGAWNLGSFLDNTLESELSVIDLNVQAPAILAHEFGRQMAKRGRGGIIFLSSVAAYQGTPFVANYAATKAYNLLFAEALNYELKPFGVDVLALSPGPTATEGSADMDFSALPMKTLPASFVARKALAKLGRASSTIPGMLNNIMNKLGKVLFPRSINTWMMGVLFGKVAEDSKALVARKDQQEVSYS